MVHLFTSVAQGTPVSGPVARYRTGIQLDRIDAKNADVLRIVRVEVRDLILAAYLHEHSNDDAEETAEFRHAINPTFPGIDAASLESSAFIQAELGVVHQRLLDNLGNRILVNPSPLAIARLNPNGESPYSFA